MATVTTITESDVKDATLTWLANLGWQVIHGPDIAPIRRPAGNTDTFSRMVRGAHVLVSDGVDVYLSEDRLAISRYITLQSADT